MKPSESPVSRAKVRAALRRMGKDQAYLVLDDAIEHLSESDLRLIFGVVFFADQAGSWQVGVDRVRRHCTHQVPKLLAVAGAAATPAQRAALEHVTAGSRSGRG